MSPSLADPRVSQGLNTDPDTISFLCEILTLISDQFWGRQSSPNELCHMFSHLGRYRNIIVQCYAIMEADYGERQFGINKIGQRLAKVKCQLFSPLDYKGCFI